MKLFKLKKLNTLGVSHIIVPIVAVLVIGGVGSYLLGINHADAAVPYLSCTTSPSSATAPSGGSVKITQTFTNVGGGITATAYGMVGHYHDYSLNFPPTSKYTFNVGHSVPGLTHGQHYSWSVSLSTGYKIGTSSYFLVKSYISTNGHACSPEYIKVTVK